MSITLEGARLIVEASSKPRYTLAQLLTASDYTTPQPASEREWVDGSAAGRELI